jgi:hypothetical protein
MKLDSECKAALATYRTGHAMRDSRGKAFLSCSASRWRQGYGDEDGRDNMQSLPCQGNKLKGGCKFPHRCRAE